MQYIHDKKIKGHIMRGTSFVNMMDETIAGNRKAKGYKVVHESEINIKYPGREAKGSWDAARALLSQPWKEAVAHVDQYIEAVAKFPLPEPHSIKRKMKWNDDEGEIDVPRAMDGEGEMYRKGFRRKIKAPSQIVLLANLDCPWNCNKSGVFFRSVACIVLADILESKGYGVEIWAWCAGGNVFPRGQDKQFNALQVKRSDQPLDKDTLANVLSAWFTRYVIWGSWNANPVQPISIGYAKYGIAEGEEGCYDPSKQEGDLEKMFKYIEPEEATAQTYCLPEITAESSWYWCPNTGKRIVAPTDMAHPIVVEKIVKCCTDILTEIIRRESE